MKHINRIFIQILFVAHEYNLEIIDINFTNNGLKDEVVVTYKDDHGKSIFIYSYEKDNMYEVNSFANYFRNELDIKLKEE